MKSNYPPLCPEPQSPQGLIVRPDTLRMHFSVAGADRLEPDRAVPILKSAVELLTRRVQAAFPAATVQLQGFDAEGHGRGMKYGASSGSRAGGVLSVQCVVELALTPAQDFWARAQLVGSLTALAYSLSDEAKRLKPPLEAILHEPGCTVKDPEPFRAALLTRWVARMNELARAAGTEKAPLVIVECSPPGEIVQQQISVDEVLLTLGLAGRLGVLS